MRRIRLQQAKNLQFLDACHIDMSIRNGGHNIGVGRVGGPGTGHSGPEDVEATVHRSRIERMEGDGVIGSGAVSDSPDDGGAGHGSIGRD